MIQNPQFCILNLPEEWSSREPPSPTLLKTLEIDSTSNQPSFIPILIESMSRLSTTLSLHTPSKENSFFKDLELQDDQGDISMIVLKPSTDSPQNWFPTRSYLYTFPSSISSITLENVYKGLRKRFEERLTRLEGLGLFVGLLTRVRRGRYEMRGVVMDLDFNFFASPLLNFDLRREECQENVESMLRWVDWFVQASGDLLLQGRPEIQRRAWLDITEQFDYDSKLDPSTLVFLD
jgi:hypothetical protein